MSRSGAPLLGLLLCLGCRAPAAAPRWTVRPPGVEHPTGRIELRGVLPRSPASSAAAPLLELCVRDAATRPDGPAILGATRVEGDALCFEPRFPLRTGRDYVVALSGGGAERYEFSLPARALEPVVPAPTVHPATARVPANLLKFYLQFEGPMRRGEAYRRVRLRDAAGEEVVGAFLEIEPELWNPARTRVTLLIDPGRIKRGLVPHEELGPVLHPERDYVLEVDAAWRDDRGAPLRAGLRHAFRTTAADARCPDPHQWLLEAPRAGTRAPLTVRFDEPLDRALALRLLAVTGPDGADLDGAGELSADQLRWRFTPRSPWRPAPHALVVPAVLEDLAGNSVGRPFEVAAANEHDVEREDVAVRLSFLPI